MDIQLSHDARLLPTFSEMTVNSKFNHASLLPPSGHAEKLQRKISQVSLNVDSKAYWLPVNTFKIQ